MSKHARGSSRRGSRVAAVLGTGLFLASLAVLCPAAETPGGMPPVIVRVTAEVNGREAGPEVVSLAGIKPGQPYSLKAVQDAVRKLFASELFSEVEALRAGQGEVTLTFRLKRRETVRSVSFQAPRTFPRPGWDPS